MPEIRRTYTVTLEDIQTAWPDLVLTCPTEAERRICEDGFTVFGSTLPGEDITGTCTGGPLDCPFDDGECAVARSEAAIPPSLRKWEDFAWQREPFRIGDQNGTEGTRQSPGLDLTESYWLARLTGAITDGEGQVLAWQDLGSCD